MLKIVGGKYRSRNIEVPPSLEVPSKNIVREGIMNALNGVLDGTVCLDLFAGSGALGIEALSRGAKYCYFVEINKESAGIIQKNLNTLKEPNGMVFNGDFIEILNKTSEKYDIVFIDPPYKEKEFYERVPKYLLEHERLSEKAVLVLEYEGEISIPKECFSRYKEYHYGRTKVLILWR